MTAPRFKPGDQVRINNGMVQTIRSWPDDNVGPFAYVQELGDDALVWGQGWAEDPKLDIRLAEDPARADELEAAKQELQAKLDAAMAAIAERDALIAAQKAAPADTVVIDDEPAAPPATVTGVETTDVPLRPSRRKVGPGANAEEDDE